MAKDSITGVRRAIKLLDKKLANLRLVNRSTTAAAALANEISILKKLKHPNVVRLKEVMDEPGQDATYIVMEYVGRRSIRSKLDAGTLAPGQIWGYFRDVLKGLLYCHEKVNVVHRDIKPENLLVTKDGKVKISDFGCSTIIKDDTSLINDTMGTNFFFSPEICSGVPHTGKPSDVWALGVTLYLMLFNTYPFKANGNEYKKLYHQIQECEPNYPEDYKDKDAIDLLKKMFIKDPNKRITLQQVREHEWVTVIGKFPVDDRYEEDGEDSDD